MIQIAHKILQDQSSINWAIQFYGADSWSTMNSILV